ncbi:MAG: hypothetical protein ABI920_08600 [Casimicrobiaceae bacterium]
MDLTLSFPGLLDTARDPGEPARAPILASMLAAARAVRQESEGRIAALAPRFGVSRTGDWPLAALALVAAGHDPAGRYWLRATPVSLEAGRDDVRLVAAVRDLVQHECDALLALLNTHFSADGLVFVAIQPWDWLVGAASAPALVTHDLATALGHRLRPYLPSGGDAALWSRWEQEIEMLLHEHPVNVARESAARLPVNAVWFQHGGHHPRATTVPGLRVWGDDPDVLALAAHAQASVVADLPASLAAILAATRHADHIVAPARALPLATIEHDFAVPAARALARGSLDQVTILADGAGTPAVAWTLAATPWWRRIGDSITGLLADRGGGSLADVAARALAGTQR